MSKKINELDAATNPESLNDSYLFAIADPINGIAKKETVAQAKEVFWTKRFKYVGLGTENKTITIPTLAGKDIIAIFRGVGIIYESDLLVPESDEYKWDQADITLGVEVNAGEKFLIIYKNF
jgi:hypothetical protein